MYQDCLYQLSYFKIKNVSKQFQLIMPRSGLVRRPVRESDGGSDSR